MTRRSEIPGQAGNDERQAGNDDGYARNDERTSGNDGNYTVTPNNIHMESSFQVHKADFERELLAMRERHPESQVWNGLFCKQTAHADLNWPQPWLIRLGYTVLGTLAWPFIK